MNNEIKEILDRVKENPQHDFILSNKHTQQLLDYITNLQEENDILKRDIEAMKHNYNLLVRLVENGESMTQKFENGLTYQDYKSRCEKAIPMLKELNIKLKDILKIGIDIKEISDIENILNGGDDNE